MNKKEARDFLTHYICSCPYGNSPANCGDDNCQFGMAVRTLCVEDRPQGEWIPVSERLPDLFEVVLVTDETNNVFEYERRPLDEEGNVCREWSFLGRKIIAWMPLPEPYKEETDNAEGCE